MNKGFFKDEDNMELTTDDYLKQLVWIAESWTRGPSELIPTQEALKYIIESITTCYLDDQAKKLNERYMVRSIDEGLNSLKRIADNMEQSNKPKVRKKLSS